MGEEEEDSSLLPGDCWTWQEVSRDSADSLHVGPLSPRSSTFLSPPGFVSLAPLLYKTSAIYPYTWLLFPLTHCLVYLILVLPLALPSFLVSTFTPSGPCFLKGHQRLKSWISGISSALPSLSLLHDQTMIIAFYSGNSSSCLVCL